SSPSGSVSVGAVVSEGGSVSGGVEASVVSVGAAVVSAGSASPQAAATRARTATSASHLSRFILPPVWVPAPGWGAVTRGYSFICRNADRWGVVSAAETVEWLVVGDVVLVGQRLDRRRVEFPRFRPGIRPFGPGRSRLEIPAPGIGFLQLLPVDRHRHGGAVEGSQRPRAHRRLGPAVAEPVDEDPALAVLLEELGR